MEQGTNDPCTLKLAKEEIQDYAEGGGRNQILSQMASANGLAVSLGWTKAIL
jgi:hypothetical protein